MRGEDRQSVKKIGIRAAKRYQKYLLTLNERRGQTVSQKNRHRAAKRYLNYLLTLNKRRGEGEVGWGAVGGGASRAA